MGLFWKMTGSLMPTLVARNDAHRKRKVVHPVEIKFQSYFLPAKRMARLLHPNMANSGRDRRAGKREGNSNGAESLIRFLAPFVAGTICN